MPIIEVVFADASGYFEFENQEQAVAFLDSLEEKTGIYSFETTTGFAAVNTNHVLYAETVDESEPGAGGNGLDDDSDLFVDDDPDSFEEDDLDE